MKYYTLMAFHSFSGWEIEFGDYDKLVVKEELEALKDGGHKRNYLKIISSEDDQESIKLEFNKNATYTKRMAKEYFNETYKHKENPTLQISSRGIWWVCPKSGECLVVQTKETDNSIGELS